MKNEFDFIGFWASKCRLDMKKCRQEVLAYNDAQIAIANGFYKRLEKTMGKRRVLELKGLRGAAT